MGSATCVAANISHCSSPADLPCVPDEEKEEITFAPALLHSDLLPGATTFRESQAASRQRAVEDVQLHGQLIREKPEDDRKHKSEARQIEAKRRKQAEEEAARRNREQEELAKRLEEQREQDRRRDLEALEAEGARRRQAERDEEESAKRKKEEEDQAKRIEESQELAAKRQQEELEEQARQYEQTEAETARRKKNEQQESIREQERLVTHRAQVEAQAAQRQREDDEQARLRKEEEALSARFDKASAESKQRERGEKQEGSIGSEQIEQTMTRATPSEREGDVTGLTSSDGVDALLVEDSELEGFWNQGEIRGNMILWHTGGSSDIKVRDARFVSLKLQGKWFQGELREDGQIHWEDGDVWHRL